LTAEKVSATTCVGGVVRLCACFEFAFDGTIQARTLTAEQLLRGGSRSDERGILAKDWTRTRVQVDSRLDE